MSRNTTKIIIIIVVLIPLIIGAFVLTSGKSEAPSHDHSKHTHQEHEEATKSENEESKEEAVGNSVEISDYAYNPATLTVKVGTTVTWTNKDSVKHDVAADNPSSDAPSSELLGKGESYSFTFKKAGTYDYHCSPHPYMKGKVVVTE